ncbi:MAG: hypothetical protein Kow00109_22610 [Acidobacteriota bacterium]
MEDEWIFSPPSARGKEKPFLVWGHTASRFRGFGFRVPSGAVRPDDGRLARQERSDTAETAVFRSNLKPET